MESNKKNADHPESGCQGDSDRVLAPAVDRQKKRRATGPRTQAGKKRSRMNSLTHGLFAKDIIIGRESLPTYRRLQKSLTRDFQPQTHTGSLLVAKLAHEFWRLSRFYSVEATEVSSQTQMLPPMPHGLPSAMVQILLQGDYCLVGGLMAQGSYPPIHDFCLSLLRSLRDKVQARGLAFEDMKTLTRLYGKLQTSEENPQENLAYTYYAGLVDLCVAEREGGPKRCLSAEEWRDRIVGRIDNELCSLTESPSLAGETGDRNGRGDHVAQGGQVIPSLGRIALLATYERGLENSLERTFKQILALRQLKLL